MKHVRIGDENPWGIAPNPATLGFWCVTVIDRCTDSGIRGQVQEGIPLVSLQGLERKQEECVGLRICQKLVQYGNLVSQGFPAGRAGGEHGVSPLQGEADRVGLVRIWGIDSHIVEQTRYSGIKLWWKRLLFRGLLMQDLVVDHIPTALPGIRQPLEEFVQHFTYHAQQYPVRKRARSYL
jgi:hypothetical protein